MTSEATPTNHLHVPGQYEVHRLIADFLQGIPHEIPEALLHNETFLREVVNEIALLLRRGQTSEVLEITEKYHLKEHQDLLHEDTIHYYAVQAANHLAGGGFEQEIDRKKLIEAFSLLEEAVR